MHLKYEFSINEIRKGEENDGELESTDIFLVTQEVTLLINVTIDGTVTYAIRNPFTGLDIRSGTIRKGDN